MRKYIILTADIRVIGGMQCYVMGKLVALEKMGWEVQILFYGLDKGRPCIFNKFTKFKKNRIPEMGLPPFSFPKIIVKTVLKRMLKRVGNIEEKYDEVIIESHDDKTAPWGEMLAKALGARHIIFLLNEKYRGKDKYYKAFIDYYKFKLNRKEILGSDSAVKFLFEDYEDDCVHTFKTNLIIEEDPIQDVYNEKLDKLVRADWNICYLGRAEKSYVPYIIEGVGEFARRHMDKRIQFIMVGDAAVQRKNLAEYIVPLSNMTLVELGDLHPLPKNLYTKVDVVIAGSGSARCSVYEGVPVIVADAITYKSEGLLGYQTQESVSNVSNSQQQSFAESLEDVFVNLLHRSLPFSYPKKITPEDCTIDNFKQIHKADKKLIYYDEDKLMSGEKDYLNAMKLIMSNVIDKTYVTRVINSVIDVQKK